MQVWQSHPPGTQTQPFPPSKCSPTSDLSLSTRSLTDQKHWNDTLWMPLGCWDSCAYFRGQWWLGWSGLPVGTLNRPIFWESCERWMVFIHLYLKIEGNKWWELLCLRPSLSRIPAWRVHHHGLGLNINQILTQKLKNGTRCQWNHSHAIFETIQEHRSGFTHCLSHVGGAVVCSHGVHLTQS